MVVWLVGLISQYFDLKLSQDDISEISTFSAAARLGLIIG